MKDFVMYILWTLGIGIVSWLSERLIKFINTKIQNEKFAHYLTAATTAVTDAVKAVQQEYVDGLKKAGKFDEEAAKEALMRAKVKVLEALSVETRKYITENIGDINKWIETTIHSVLHDMKEKANGH